MVSRRDTIEGHGRYRPARRAPGPSPLHAASPLSVVQGGTTGAATDPLGRLPRRLSADPDGHGPRPRVPDRLRRVPRVQGRAVQASDRRGPGGHERHGQAACGRAPGRPVQPGRARAGASRAAGGQGQGPQPLDRARGRHDGPPAGGRAAQRDPREDRSRGDGGAGAGRAQDPAALTPAGGRRRRRVLRLGRPVVGLDTARTAGGHRPARCPVPSARSRSSSTTATSSIRARRRARSPTMPSSCRAACADAADLQAIRPNLSAGIPVYFH